ncbi:efflux RND transporter periplasmic adaptor subunit [Nonlabens ulvanivorans]|uniref:Cation transporter n=1 Tax=Nonlabens ulvanivorans TaxID=906888 RepID=A0A084JYS3_NONUL|nr:efflux RND transporter periplasmic adaptor subunit [Nonlabens ulvanivorans]KEZ94107.1 cation transporter [Nonlabens ulvanivorans]PRX13093.1 cobalt-zinc-cadmium efflux system membrane fusion protein [Nonlabens ulvanivorans]
MQRIINKYTFLILLLVLASCGEKESTSLDSQTSDTHRNDDRIFVSTAQFENSNMTLGKLIQQPFPITVKTTGMIDVPPENRAVVNATMGGYIKSTPLLIGDKVRKGQVLVSIENPDFVKIQQEYLEVKEQMTYLRVEYERHQTMMDENITSQKSFLKAESSYKTINARYTGLRKQLQMLNISPSNVEAGTIVSVVNIYAPISGSITKVNVTRGTYVSPATAILEIIDNDHLHLELSVFEKDILKLQKGQKINFKIPESSNETFLADVHLIGTTIEDNRTIKVHGHINSEKEIHFLTGMFVEAGIVIDSASAKALPETAVANMDNENYVLILDETTNAGYYFTQVEVEIGQQLNQYIEIVTDSKINDEITFLIKGAFNLVGESGSHDH